MVFARSAMRHMSSATPPKYWHKLPFWDFVQYELMRKGTFPFVCGGGFMLFIAVMVNNGVTEEDKKNSFYYQNFVVKKGLGDTSHGDSHH